MAYYNQFPADYTVPTEVIHAAEKARFVDVSYGNDVCPSWGFDFTPDEDVTPELDPWQLRLWVQHPDAGRRETGGLRFAVCALAEGRLPDGLCLIETDDEGHMCEWLHRFGGVDIIDDMTIVYDRTINTSLVTVMQTHINLILGTGSLMTAWRENDDTITFRVFTDLSDGRAQSFTTGLQVAGWDFCADNIMEPTYVTFRSPSSWCRDTLELQRLLLTPGIMQINL